MKCVRIKFHRFPNLIKQIGFGHCNYEAALIQYGQYCWEWCCVLLSLNWALGAILGLHLFLLEVFLFLPPEAKENILLRNGSFKYIFNLKNKASPHKYCPFSWHKLKNYMPKIKWLLFLNPFDNRHNPGLFWKVTLWGLLFKSIQNYTKYYWFKVVTAAQTQWKWKFFFSLKRFSVFDWIQIIVAVAVELRNTMEPSHNTRQPFQRTISPKMSILHFSNLCRGGFPKRTFSDSNRLRRS